MENAAERDIEKAVNQFDPNNATSQIKDLSGHNNSVFKIELENKTVICKFCTGKNGSQDCRKEVNMHQLLQTQTEVRTPEILYSDCSAEKTKFPFFITEHIPGRSLQDSFPKLNSGQQVEIVEQAGSILGEIHSKISFRYAGELKPGHESIKVGGKSDWLEYITEELSQAIQKAEDTRFSDLTKKAEEVVTEISRLEEPENTLVFYDFRPENVIAEDGKIKALIDFERAWTGDPLWDYAYSEMSFVEPHHYYDMHKPPNADEEKLRKIFQKCYKQERELEENWREKVNLYKLGIIIKRFNSFKGWTESTEMTEEEIKRQEKLLRSNFNRLYQDQTMFN